MNERVKDVGTAVEKLQQISLYRVLVWKDKNLNSLKVKASKLKLSEELDVTLNSKLYCLGCTFRLICMH